MSSSSLDSSLLISLLQFGSGTTVEYARDVAAHAARSRAEVTNDVSGESSFYSSGQTTSTTVRGGIWGGVQTGNLEHYPSLASTTSSLSPEMLHRRNDLRRQLENQTTNLNGLRERLQREMQEDNEDRWLKQHKKQTNGRFDGAQRRELRRFFRALDIDRSGEISIAELESPLLTTGVVSSMKELEDLVKKIDYNQSGEIDLQEFMAAFKPASKSKTMKMSREEASIFHDIKMSQMWKDDANPNVRKVKRKGGEHEGTVYKTLHSSKAIAAERAAERGEAREEKTHPAVAALLMGGGSLIDDEDEKNHEEATFSAFDELLKVLEGRTLDAVDETAGEKAASTKKISKSEASRAADPILKLKKEPPVYVLRSQHLHGAGSPKLPSPKLSKTLKSIPGGRGKVGRIRSLSPTRRGKNAGSPSIATTHSSPHQVSSLSISPPIAARSTTPSPRTGGASSPTSKAQEVTMPDLRLSQRSSLASRQSEQGGVLKSYSIEAFGSGGGSGGGGGDQDFGGGRGGDQDFGGRGGRGGDQDFGRGEGGMTRNESEVQSSSFHAPRGIPKHVLVAGAAKLSLQTRLASHRRRFVLNLIITERDKYLIKRGLVSDEMKLSFQRGDETRGGTLRQILRHVDLQFQKMMDRMKALMKVITTELDGGDDDEEEEENEEENSNDELDGDDVILMEDRIRDERGGGGGGGGEFNDDSIDPKISQPVFSNSSRLLKSCRYRLRVQELRAEGYGVEQASRMAMEEIKEEGKE